MYSSSDNTMKPRFYNIGPTDYSNQDTPRNDGLACSFILGNPDQLDYHSLYDACITLLAAGSRCDRATNDKFTLLVSNHFCDRYFEKICIL